MRNPEALLLSALIRQGDYPVILAANLEPKQFHSYAKEFEWIIDYQKKYRRMPSRNAFRNNFPTFPMKAVDDTAHFAEEVIAYDTRHRLIGAMNDVTDKITAGDVAGAVKAAFASIVSISADVGRGQDLDVISDWESIVKETQERVNRVKLGGTPGVPFGFPTLDERTGGAQPGEFWVIGARLGEGKSWFLQGGCTTALMCQKTAVYDTMEMSRTEVAYRIHGLLSAHYGQTQFSNLDLHHGKGFDMDKYKAFLEGLNRHVRGALHVTDGSRGAISPTTIAAQIERHNPDVVYVDYLTLMEGAIGGDHLSIAKLTGEMKSLAQRYQVPIIAAAQLNRTHGIGEDVAGPEALAKGDSIGMDADNVVNLKKMSERTLVMKMAKDRHGPGGFKWYVHHEPARGIFNEVSYEKFSELREEDREVDEQEKITGKKLAQTRPARPKTTRLGKKKVYTGSVD